MTPFDESGGFGAASAGWMGSQDGGVGNGTTIFQAGSNSTTPSASQQAIINQFKFAAAKSIRMSTIILACFNTIAAFATALGILYDCYHTTRRHDLRFKFRRAGFSFVQTAEVFPLILSCGITIQGIVFAVAQSTGLDRLLSTGCTLISQFMLPAIFIVPFIQLVFAAEVTLRGLRNPPFPHRGKWDVTICLAVIGLFLLATFLVADFIRAGNFCFASLFWFVARWAAGCFGLLTAIVATLLICCVLISWRLSTSNKVNVSERVAASRMVYYLALGIISNTLMIPFFFELAFYEQSDPRNQVLTLSMVASVVANVSGLMTGGLHLFLRSNKLATIGPKNKSDRYDRQQLKRGIRLWPLQSSSVEYQDHIMQPVSGGRDGLRTSESNASLIGTEKGEEAMIESPANTPVYDRPNPFRSNTMFPIRDVLRPPSPAQMQPILSPRPPSPLQPVMSPREQNRKQTYSLFPVAGKPINLLPATTYSPNMNRQPKADPAFDPNTLQLPPRFGGLRGHRRDSSMVSSATVQIGLRLSNVDDMPPINKKMIDDARVHNLDCPERLPGDGDTSKRPSPLDNSETVDESVDESVYDSSWEMESPCPTPGPSSRRNSSPPAPERQDETTLSPVAYNPQSPTKAKLASPRGVGFGAPARSNTTGSTLGNRSGASKHAWI